MPFKIRETTRHVYLPDAASGIFAPGWDIGLDASSNPQHLAAYTLGSPFPEDSKLCAALSSYWPAVAPDAGRSFWRGSKVVYPSVSPLTDDEIGSTGDSAWDGSIGPKIVNDVNNLVEYQKLDYVDYVDNGLENKFSLSKTINVDLSMYKQRISAISQIYYALDLIPSPPDPTADLNEVKQYLSHINQQGLYPVISFREVSVNDSELQEAQTKTGKQLSREIF